MLKGVKMKTGDIIEVRDRENSEWVSRELVSVISNKGYLCWYEKGESATVWKFGREVKMKAGDMIEVRYTEIDEWEQREFISMSKHNKFLCWTKNGKGANCWSYGRDVKQWYNNIPKQGVICWVWDIKESEKTIRVISSYSDNYAPLKFVSKSGIFWLNAVPVKCEELL